MPTTTSGLRRIPRSLAAILAVTAVAVPAAHADSLRDSGPANNAAAAPALRDSGPANNAVAAQAPALRDSGPANNVAQVQAPAPGPARGQGLVRVDAPPALPAAPDGFDWEAAGLGAGTAAALGLLGFAGLQARSRSTGHPAG